MINTNLVMNLNIESIPFVQVSNEVNVHSHSDQLDPMIYVLYFHPECRCSSW